MRRLLLAFLLLAGAAQAAPSEVRRAEHFASPALGHDLGFDLYLPPDLPDLAQVPVIYLLHGTDSSGGDWLDQGDLATCADRLIAAGELPRVIVVMPDAENSWYVDSPPHSGAGAYGTAIGRELPRWIEAHFPARRDGAGRAIGGYSMGGFGSLRLALAHPGNYAAVGVMSGAFWTFIRPDSRIEGKLAEATQQIFGGSFGDPFEPKRFLAESPLTLARELPAGAPRPAVMMISGANEVFHMREEQEAATPILRAAGIPLETALTQGDHDWDNWRQMLPRILEFLGAHIEPPVEASRTQTAHGRGG
jgi:enterochelin esterase family protein